MNSTGKLILWSFLALVLLALLIGRNSIFPPAIKSVGDLLSAILSNSTAALEGR